MSQLTWDHTSLRAEVQAGTVVAVRRGILTESVVAAVCLCLVGCGGGSGSAHPKPTVTTPTGSPFSASFTGPDVAQPGQTVTATLTNTGRLPDKYQFQADPVTAATISPFTVSLAPGRSTKVMIKVTTVPLIVRVQDASAGLGGSETSLSIGAQG